MVAVCCWERIQEISQRKRHRAESGEHSFVVPRTCYHASIRVWQCTWSFANPGSSPELRCFYGGFIGLAGPVGCPYGCTQAPVLYPYFGLSHLVSQVQSSAVWGAHHECRSRYSHDSGSYKGCRGVQPAAQGPHAAQGGCECGPTQNCKLT